MGRRLLQVFQPEDGGVPAYVGNLVEGLAERGWEVGIVGPSTPAVDRPAARLGLERFELCAKRTPQRRDLRLAAALARLIRAKRIDLVHAHSTKAGALVALAGRLAGVPTVYTPHAWAFGMDVAAPRRALYAGAELAAARLAHRMITLVSHDERSAALRLRLAPAERLRVIHTGIREPELPARETARRSLGVPLDAVVAAWIGRAGPQKQPEHVADLAARLRGAATFVVLGRGVAASPAGSAIASAGGIVAPDGTPPTDLLAAADVLVQTSAWEGLPISILEAMMAGLPTVAYGVGGVPELVDDGVTGFLAAPDAVGVVAERVALLARDRALRAAMGEAAAARAHRCFGYDQMITALEDVYAGILAGASGPAGTAI